MKLDQLCTENARLGEPSKSTNGSIDAITNFDDTSPLPIVKSDTGDGSEDEQRSRTKKKRDVQVTDDAQKSLIRTLWFYNNTDST